MIPISKPTKPLTASEQPETEYELKLSARVSSDLLTDLLTRIGTAGAAIDFMKAHPVTPPPVLVANPDERLVLSPEPVKIALDDPLLPAPVEDFERLLPDKAKLDKLKIDHEEIKRLAKKLAANKQA